MTKIKTGAVPSVAIDPLRSAMISGAVMVGLAILLGTAGCASSTGSQAGSNAINSMPTLPETLSADPRFTDLVHVIRFAGQWQTFADAHDVTMLAPTNAAFHSSDKDWGAVLTGDDDNAIAKRKTFLKPLLIQGKHPPAEFAGKMQDVRSIAGDVLHMDGRTPGMIIITAGQTSSPGIGFPKRAIRESRTELPPLVTSSGLIYPVDTIIVQ